MPLKNPTRLVSEGCPLSTEWEVIERGFGGCAIREGGFEGCPRAMSLRLKPPLLRINGYYLGNTIKFYPKKKFFISEG